jgi:hypothetical protein
MPHPPNSASPRRLDSEVARAAEYGGEGRKAPEIEAVLKKCGERVVGRESGISCKVLHALEAHLVGRRA